MPVLICIIVVLLFLSVYAWSIYNIPIFVAGVGHLHRRRRKLKDDPTTRAKLPTFSIIIPAKNEEKVVGRLLDALAKLNYPADKKEIIVVEAT